VLHEWGRSNDTIESFNLPPKHFAWTILPCFKHFYTMLYCYTVFVYFVIMQKHLIKHFQVSSFYHVNSSIMFKTQPTNMSWWHRWYNGYSVLDSSVVDCGFEPRSGLTKDYKLGICCFFTEHASLRRKSKEYLARNQNNVSECSDVSTHGLLFQWASTLKTQPSVLC
jgi:hypothetical protein